MILNKIVDQKAKNMYTFSLHYALHCILKNISNNSMSCQNHVQLLLLFHIISFFIPSKLSTFVFKARANRKTWHG